jgi:hypothetical protein
MWLSSSIPDRQRSREYASLSRSGPDPKRIPCLLSEPCAVLAEGSERRRQKWISWRSGRPDSTNQHPARRTAQDLRMRFHLNYVISQGSGVSPNFLRDNASTRIDRYGPEIRDFRHFSGSVRRLRLVPRRGVGVIGAARRRSTMARGCFMLSTADLRLARRVRGSMARVMIGLHVTRRQAGPVRDWPMWVEDASLRKRA